VSAPRETAHDESGGLRDAPSASVGGAAGLEVWVRHCCALVVASVAAYVSYAHQREFALQGGVDVVSATLWPLSVDGLLLLATVGLLNSARGVAAAETRFEGGPNRDRDETKAPRERKSQRTETRQRRIGESRAERPRAGRRC
jgi:hypothetical protein